MRNTQAKTEMKNSTVNLRFSPLSIGLYQPVLLPIYSTNWAQALLKMTNLRSLRSASGIILKAIEAKPLARKYSSSLDYQKLLVRLLFAADFLLSANNHLVLW